MAQKQGKELLADVQNMINARFSGVYHHISGEEEVITPVDYEIDTGPDPLQPEMEGVALGDHTQDLER